MLNYIKNKCPWVLVRKSEYESLETKYANAWYYSRLFEQMYKDKQETLMGVYSYLATLNGKTASVPKLKRILED